MTDASTETREWTVPAADDATHLGRFLARELGEEVSRRGIKRALEQGCGLVNGEVERFNSRRLSPGDRVTFRLMEEFLSTPRLPVIGKARLLLVDEHIVVLDKPPGYDVELDSGPSSLAEGMAEVVRRRKLGRLLPCHRLDRETSGALLLARSPMIQDKAFRIFRKRGVMKAYEAITLGDPGAAVRTLESHIGRVGESGGQAVWGSRPGGLEAITELRRLATRDGLSHLRLFPKTGRTHQLRVQLSEAGMPILGDLLYGREASARMTAPRHMLHARGLVFTHPITGKRVAVEAPVPADFREALARCGLPPVESYKS